MRTLTKIKTTNQQELVTKGYLEHTLDQQFSEFEKKIDKKFDKTVTDIMEYIDLRLEPMEEIKKDVLETKKLQKKR